MNPIYYAFLGFLLHGFIEALILHIKNRRTMNIWNCYLDPSGRENPNWYKKPNFYERKES